MGTSGLVAFFLIFFFQIGFFTGLENFFEDLLFVQQPVHSDIVIIAIDNESIEKIGQWPWKREVFANTLKKLEKYSPKAVGLDVVFPEESRFGTPDDQFLEDALKNLSYPLVLAIKADSFVLKNNQAYTDSFSGQLKKFKGQTNPIKSSEAGAPSSTEQFNGVNIGHVNLISDPDSVVRKFPIFIQSKQEKIPAFSYLITKNSGAKIPKEESLEQISRIVFSAAPGTISRIPFYRIISEEIPLSRLGNKIILIGSTAVDLHDEQPTPLSKGTQMQGVEIQANIINMLISGYQLKPLSSVFVSLWMLLVCLCSTLIFTIFKSSFKPLFFNAILGVFWLGAMLLLIDEGIMPNLIYITGAWFFSTISLFGCRYFTGENEKREIKKAFSRYVSKEVLEEILKDPKHIALGGEERHITILFSDIRGFTSLSEKLSPQELVGILNKYFNIMSKEILTNKGVLDKYIGDAIMAFWGAPVKDGDQTDNAVQAAVSMVKQLKKFNKELKEKKGLELDIGIGIYSGRAIVGNIGSETRFDYTAIGDSVNIASRIEGLTKEHKTKIIISDSVKNNLKNKYTFELLGSVEIRGRKELVKIYKVLI